MLYELCMAVEDGEDVEDVTGAARDHAVQRGLKVIEIFELTPTMILSDFSFLDEDNLSEWLEEGVPIMRGLNALFPGRMRELVNFVHIRCDDDNQPCLRCPLIKSERVQLENDIMLQLLL